MAGISDMLVQKVLSTSNDAPDVAGSIQKGAQLAQNIEEMQLRRQQIEQQKQEVEIKKIDKFTSLYETAAKLPPGKARNAMFKTVIPKTRDALGLQNHFPDDSVELLNAEPDLVPYLKSRVEAGDFSFPELMQNAKNPEWLAKKIPDLKQWTAQQSISDVVYDNGSQIQESDTKRIADVEGLKRANAMATAQDRRQKSGQEFTATQDDKTKARHLSDKLIELNIPSVESTMKKIDKFVPGGIDGYDGKSQIEGIGGTDALIPTGRLSAKGRANRQLSIDMGNQYIKMATGSGMSNEEAIRLLNSTGLDFAPTEGGGIRVLFNKAKSSADFVNGMKNLRDKMGEIKSTAYAGAGPNAVSYFEQNKQAFSKPEKKKQPPSDMLEVSGKQVSMSDLKKAYGGAKNKEKFVEDMAKATGKTVPETLKLLGN